MRKIFKAHPCKTLTGMIDTDHVPIRKLTGSLQLGRIEHEDLTCTTSSTVGRAKCTAANML